MAGAGAVGGAGRQRQDVARIRSTLSPRYRSKHFTDATSSRRSTLPRVVQGEGPPHPLSGVSATTGGALARGRRKIDGRHRRRDDAMEVGARGPTGREAAGGASQEGGTSKKEGPPSSDAPTSAREFAREATRTQPRLIARRTSPRRSPALKAFRPVQIARAPAPGRAAGGDPASALVPRRRE